MLITQKYNKTLSHIKTKLLISCPKDPKDPNYLGGLFVVDFTLNNISQILVGDCRGIVSFDQGYYVATNTNGILKLDKQFNVLNQYDTPSLDLHGVKMDNQSLLYIAETKLNAIGIYRTEPFERIDEIKISPYDEDHNHINDIWIDNDSIFVSMFSLEGDWRKKEGVYDGVIAEYNIKTKSLNKIIHKGLKLPHTILVQNNNMYYCESLDFNLKKDETVLAQFNGFTRGFAYDDWYFYVGQSELRHLDRMLPEITNITLDCGIHVFDSIDRSNHFFHFPANQIYEILIIDKDITVINPPSVLELNEPHSIRHLPSPKEWHGPEPTLRWMASKRASIQLFTQEPAKTLTVEYFNGFQGIYPLKIYINNLKSFEIELSSNKETEIEFQLEEIFIGNAKITFEVNELWKPSEMLGSDDMRELGIAISKVSLR
jgi:hypothetical protein